MKNLAGSFSLSLSRDPATYLPKEKDTRKMNNKATALTTKVRFSKMTYHDFGFPTYIMDWQDGNRDGFVVIILKKDHVVLRIVEHGAGLLTRNTDESLPVADILAMVRDVIHATPAGLAQTKPHL